MIYSFGFYPQTQQGADIIAESLGARVYMPDVFFGYVDYHPFLVLTE